jgi:hypothetical protein
MTTPRPSAEGEERDRDRGQLVLLAAVALAVALVPLVLAYLQLGYHEDIHGGTSQSHTQQVDATLERATHDVVSGIPAEYAWTERSTAVDAVQTRLEPTEQAITTAGLGRGTATAVSYNKTRAKHWADTNCPGGPDRQFGPCLADEGIVIQERQGRTHVLAVAVDVRVTAPEQTVQLSTTIGIRAG